MIEAMHSNVFPVVSDVGNAREYIVQGYNGFIFRLDATPEKVAELIEQAYLRNPKLIPPYNDVSDTVAHYTWENYRAQMRSIIMDEYAVHTIR